MISLTEPPEVRGARIAVISGVSRCLPIGVNLTVEARAESRMAPFSIHLIKPITEDAASVEAVSYRAGYTETCNRCRQNVTHNRHRTTGGSVAVCIECDPEAGRRLIREAAR